MAKIGLDRNVLIAPNSQPPLAFSYICWSQLLSATGCTKWKLGIKRSISVDKSTVYLQKALKKARKTPLETGESVSSYDKKEKDVMDDVETATYSTLNKTGKTAMSKFMIGMAPL